MITFGLYVLGFFAFSGAVVFGGLGILFRHELRESFNSRNQVNSAIFRPAVNNIPEALNSFDDLSLNNMTLEDPLAGSHAVIMEHVDFARVLASAGSSALATEANTINIRLRNVFSNSRLEELTQRVAIDTSVHNAMHYEVAA